jgi:phenylpropionate dioxygenase-like ring-hydroxylating dioxygenase large terminal subunit
MAELETDEYYPLHQHTRKVNLVKVHAQMIIENAADPYHVQYVHKAANPATTASFEVSGYHLHATVNAHFGGGRAQTWLTPNGPVDAKIIYDNYSLGLGVVRFPSELVATCQVTGQTPVDEDYTDYFYTQASVREPGDSGDKPSGRAARFLALQQEVIKQDFFTWENMKYLEKPNLAPEEAHDYAALRRWAHRFYPGEQSSPHDFGYTADGEPDPAAAQA